MDPHPSQQHAGLQHAVRQVQQEGTRPKARLKPTSPGKSGVDGGANQVPTYLDQSLHLYSQWTALETYFIVSRNCLIAWTFRIDLLRFKSTGLDQVVLLSIIQAYLSNKEEKPHTLFIFLVFFTHLVPPTGLFWTIFSPCHSSQFHFPVI